MTANVGSEDRENCLAAGMNDFLSKPVNRQRLEGLISDWADRLTSRSQGPCCSSECGGTVCDGPLLDETIRDNLTATLGADGFWVLASRLRKLLPREIENLRIAVVGDDSTSVHAIAQALHASCVNLGFVCLSSALDRLERITNHRGHQRMDAWERVKERADQTLDLINQIEPDR